MEHNSPKQAPPAPRRPSTNLLPALLLFFVIIVFAGAVISWESIHPHTRITLGHDHSHPTDAKEYSVPRKFKNARVYREHLTTWPYTCWTPKAGMSTPHLTMVSIMGGLPHNYTEKIRQNRLNFAAIHGHRYCELKVIDQHKIAAFTKLPFMLALAPCTTYTIHLDADSMIQNHTLSFKPWMDFMERNGIDQLLPNDVIIESPINFGVFMIRTAPWIWKFWKKLYNHCTCDWGRTHDWPAEQGIIYDLLADNLESFETQRSAIVPGRGWNHILGHKEMPLKGEDVVVHLTYPTIYPKEHFCLKQEFSKKCKYIGLEHFLTDVIGTSQHLPGNIYDHFDQGDNICQEVRTNTLFQAHITYSNQHDQQASSVMDFDVDPSTGEVLAVKVSEIGCVGLRDKKCSLPQLWDTKTGQGPWKQWPDEVI